MKSFDTELQKIAARTRLKAAERSELRERILTYMEYHPLPKSRRSLAESIESQPFVFVNFNTIYTRVAAGVFALLLVAVIPIAAERSVPGDVLYPIKTNINEGVRAQFANSPYEKVAFETELLERRVAEARLLARNGELTEEVEAAIAETVKNHAHAAQQGIAELKESDADEAAIAEIAFGSALDIQSAVLDAGQDASSTDGIAGAVKEARAVTEAQKGSSTPSYERLMARVEQETTRAVELFASINGAATDEEHTDIERRLADIDRKIAKAQGLVEEDRGGATSALATSLSLIQKVIAFMTDIDVRESVALETLVPVELTDEERLEKVAETLETIGTLWQEIRPQVADIEETALLEKVTLGIEMYTVAFERASEAIMAGNIETAEQSAAEAEAMLTDLVVLVGPKSDETLPEPTAEPATTTPEILETPVETPVNATTTKETVTEPETSEEPPATTTPETAGVSTSTESEIFPEPAID